MTEVYNKNGVSLWANAEKKIITLDTDNQLSENFKSVTQVPGQNAKAIDILKTNGNTAGINQLTAMYNIDQERLSDEDRTNGTCRLASYTGSEVPEYKDKEKAVKIFKAGDFPLMRAELFGASDASPSYSYYITTDFSRTHLYIYTVLRTYYEQFEAELNNGIYEKIKKKKSGNPVPYSLYYTNYIDLKLDFINKQLGRKKGDTDYLEEIPTKLNLVLVDGGGGGASWGMYDDDPDNDSKHDNKIAPGEGGCGGAIHVLTINTEFLWKYITNHSVEKEKLLAFKIIVGRGGDGADSNSGATDSQKGKSSNRAVVYNDKSTACGSYGGWSDLWAITADWSECDKNDKPGKVYTSTGIYNGWLSQFASGFGGWYGFGGRIVISASGTDGTTSSYRLGTDNPKAWHSPYASPGRTITQADWWRPESNQIDEIYKPGVAFIWKGKKWKFYDDFDNYREEYICTGHCYRGGLGSGSGIKRGQLQPEFSLNVDADYSHRKQSRKCKICYWPNSEEFKIKIEAIPESWFSSQEVPSENYKEIAHDSKGAYCSYDAVDDTDIETIKNSMICPGGHSWGNGADMDRDATIGGGGACSVIDTRRNGANGGFFIYY